MIYSISIILISAIALVYSFGKAGAFQKIISSLLCLALLFFQIGIKNWSLVGFALIALSALTSLFYSLVSFKINIEEIVLLGISGLLITTYIIFKISPWPYINEVKISLVLPILFFIIYIFRHQKRLSKDFGPILIWATLSFHYLIK